MELDIEGSVSQVNCRRKSGSGQNEPTRSKAVTLCVQEKVVPAYSTPGGSAERSACRDWATPRLAQCRRLAGSDPWRSGIRRPSRRCPDCPWRSVLVPQLAPAGVDDDGVARLERQVLLLDGSFEVGDGDLVGVGEHVDALEAGDINQDASGHQHADVLDAELGEAVAGRDVFGLEAIVVTVVVGLVGEAVEPGCRPGPFPRP